MRILALIPARGGSKRLPGKNIKMLGEMPLIAWTIKAAIESECCVDVLVSTDDEEIADVSIKYGAYVPWLRPSELATDLAGSVDVALHALDTYEMMKGPVDGLMLLQPTSPLRSVETIKKGYALFKNEKGVRPIVAVSPAQSHPAWCFKKTLCGMEPFLGWDALNKRSQDLEPAWVVNGLFYLISPQRLRFGLTFITSDTLPLSIIDPDEAIDIDTQDDFKRCESIFWKKYST